MARITIEDLTEEQKFRLQEIKNHYKCKTWKEFVDLIIIKLG